MDLLRDVEAALAHIVVGAGNTLESHASDTRRAHIASSRVLCGLCRARGARYTLGRDRYGRSNRCWNDRRDWDTAYINIRAATSAHVAWFHVAYDNFAGLDKRVELVLAIKVLLSDALVAVIKVLAVKTLVANPTNALGTSVTPCTMNDVRRNGSGGTDRHRASMRGSILVAGDDVGDNPQRAIEE